MQILMALALLAPAPAPTPVLVDAVSETSVQRPFSMRTPGDQRQCWVWNGTQWQLRPCR